MSSLDRRVVIVGAGPSGLSAAIELRRLGIRHVTLFEREQRAGGIPRHTNHPGFGIRDLHRVMSGPRYARTLAERARRSGVEMRLGTAIFSIDDIDADAVILATGARERPRSARLVPGDRPERDIHHGVVAAIGNGTSTRRHSGGDRRSRTRQLLGHSHA